MKQYLGTNGQDPTGQTVPIPEDGVDSIDAATISAPVEQLANDVAFLARRDGIGFPSSGITSASVGALPQTTINVANTLGFPSSGSFVVTSTGGVQTITYTGLGGGGTTFTGCTGGSGNLSLGAIVGLSSPPGNTFGMRGTGAGGTPTADPGLTGLIGTGGAGVQVGVAGYGGLAGGAGVQGWGSAAGGAGGQFSGNGGNYDGVDGVGSGSGAGVGGIGGSAGGPGVAGQGVGAGFGGSFTGGATGDGGNFLGGSTSGRGLTAAAQAGNSSGIAATGNGSGSGVHATGGTSSGSIGVTGYAGTGSGGLGVQGTGDGAGAGVKGVGGTTGAGGTFTGGTTSGAGVVGTATAGNSAGGSFTGVGSGAGVSGSSTGTGPGVSGQGGTTSGVGGLFVGGPNSSGVSATGAGTGNGIDAATDGTTFNATTNRPLGANVTGGPVHVATALGSGTSGPNNIWAEGIVKAFGILSTPGSAGAAIVNSGSIGIASATLTSSTTINVTMKQPMAGTSYVVIPGTCMASNGGGAQPAKVTFNSVISTTVFTLQLESGYDWSANASNWISFFVLGMQ